MLHCSCEVVVLAGGGGEAGSPGTAGVGGDALAFTTRCLGCWPPPRDLPGMSRAHCMVLITRDSPRSQAATACLRSGLQLHFVARSWSPVPAVPFRNHMQGAMLWWVPMAVPDGDHVPAHRWVSSSPSSPTAGESWKELELGAGLCQSSCSGSERRRAWHCASPQPMEM